MPAVFIVMIVFLAPLIALGIFASFVLAVIRVWRGEALRQNRPQRDEETRLIQEIYQGLLKMEDRIGALETILLDPERKGKDET
ncbi:MAG: phage-shock protein [Deltaproteobacteria bacterium]|nr:phage-shock protein [Deltaproteobacteria bacterium]MBW2052050.1 phage-shock protein [Deltaproteobacteria bacterium]MBW2142004.1 phage-shock protein [Deltaproteobacteria bacterium]MBW2322089.1 phage-shock protein [Deltaproteobacteria bacterium]